MILSRRNALAGLAATVGALAPFPALSLRPPVLPRSPAPAEPLSFDGYSFFDVYNPVWHDPDANEDYRPFLRSHRWHFDGVTYSTPIISCVTNSRFFLVHRFSRRPAVMVREVWIKGLTDYGARDVLSGALASAARHAAEWACWSTLATLDTVQIEGRSGAVYLDFYGDDLSSPVVTDAPPLIIHDRLTRAGAGTKATRKELRGLAQVLNDWIGDLPGVPAVVLFGSRVRGDHRPDSDVNFAVFTEEWGDTNADDEEAAEWWAQQEAECFATINALLPGPLNVHRQALFDPLLRMYEARGVPVLEVGKVVCAFTPPKPSPRQAVQKS